MTSMQHHESGVLRALFCPRRLCSTTPLEQLIINAARWDDSNYYHRLGFCEEVHDLRRIKEHYRVLAKHYHPDNPSAPPDAKAAFQSIREAYEHVASEAKEAPGRNKMAEAGFEFSDQARRKAQIRFLGDGVGLFMAMTLVLIYIVSKHNKERLHARHLWDLMLIFLTIQLFPRLLAAAILYACHTNYLVSLAECKERAATSVVLERLTGGDVSIRVNGIKAEVIENTILQVTTTQMTSPSPEAPAALRTEDSNVLLAPSTSTTLTFDAGVMSVSVPGHPGGVTEYRVKAVDMNRVFVLADLTLRV
ncbi:heat shock protein [Trypanosoma rangeli]|uniref:Heat shock protein n=1 Tax=Trypanosoma rangeli TaxID=5698 RepID=A0A3R7N2F8_TRYRA|nr:heat shock protein [Trypanosoma rangeli]RNE98965.1 heat shock protein [Trypanosoma rangeli]|eukprot:RNE98965.1 heat shock protein [Trypanosoma rangeli]